jgi:hypothetical protein
MSWIKNLVLMFFSTFLILTVSELGIRKILGHPLEISGVYKRVMLFEAVPNFKNEGDIFKYHPNTEFRSVTFYVNPDEKTAVKEYDVTIKTNNLGLVQLNHISDNTIVDLFIGDSFTEGHGASPWFYNLESERVGQIKAVNGGIVGTGPLQWLELSRLLQEQHGLNYRKTTVILIHQDITRPVWNFAPHYIACLNTGECEKNTHPWYGYVFNDSTEIKMEEYAIKKYLSQNIDLNIDVKKDDLSRFIIRKSALAYYTNAFYDEFIKEGQLVKIDSPIDFNEIEIKNLTAIKSIYQSGYDQGKVLLIPEKHEVGEFSVQLSPKSNKILDWFRKNKLAVTVCKSLRSRDFHVNDGHPNGNGYMKIKECVSELQ